MPVFGLVPMTRQCRNLWSSHRRSSLTRLTCPCVHDRCRVQPAVFSASSQVLELEGSGVALTPEFLPGVRPPVVHN